MTGASQGAVGGALGGAIIGGISAAVQAAIVYVAGLGTYGSAAGEVVGGAGILVKTSAVLRNLPSIITSQAANIGRRVIDYAAGNSWEIENRATLGADGASSRIIKIKDYTNTTIHVVHEVWNAGVIVHRDIKFDINLK